VSEWIKCSDRLPENEQKILISDGKFVTACTADVTPFWKGRGEFYPDGCEFGGYEWEWHFELEQITHWMPLPSPPQE
jgi:hypothetical protein